MSFSDELIRLFNEFNALRQEMDAKLAELDARYL